MSNFAFGTAACGRIVQLVDDILAGGNDAIIGIPMSASSTAESVETVTDFAAVEATSGWDEQTTGGWSRFTQDETGDGLAISWDATNNRMEVDSSDPVWASPTANTTGLVLCYDPDTTTGTDSTLRPLVHLDMVVTGNGQQVTFQHNAEGWHNATRS